MRAKLAPVLLAVAALTAVSAPLLAQDRSPVTITDIRQENSAKSTRLIIESSDAVAYTYYSPDPLTLVVDIPEVDASAVPARINVGTSEVESLRVTQMARADRRSLARIEVRLAGLIPYQIYSKDKSLNLVFERASGTRATSAPSQPSPAAARVQGAATARGEAKDAEAPVDAVPAAVPVAIELASPSPSPQTRDRQTGDPLPLQLGASRPEASKHAGEKQAAGSQGATPARSLEAAPSRKGPSIPGQAAPRATRILGVTPGEEDGELAVTIRADGALKYQDFFLGNPDRLVIDFRDVMSRAPYKAEVQRDPVRAVRLAQFSPASPKIARLVLDLSARRPYRIVEARDGVKILFGEGRTPKPAPLAALKVDEPEPPPAAAAERMAAALPAAAPQAPPRVIAPIALPAIVEPQAPALAPQEPAVEGPKKWQGHPISFDFKDGDLQDIFRLFADISGLNVVIQPGITGKVSLVLKEVPWDQALDIILKMNNLGYTIEENVLRIARISDLQREEADRRKLEDEKQLAGALEDWSKRVFYAKADVLSEVIKKAGALSSRGQINVDIRTNTILMRDLPRFIESAKALITDLDIPTQQVEIEAKVIVTNRNFTRDLGVQWGFLQRREPMFGNTTDRTFPNAIILNGQGTPAGGGLNPNMAGLASTAGIGTATNRGYAVNLPAAGFNSSLGVSMGNILGNFNIDAAITALERQGRGRILSTPRIMTQNNQPAMIKQGVQIPIQTVANNTVTVQFQDAVLTLDVTPQISEAGTVILKVNISNNSPDFGNLVGGIPPINTQAATTNVLVKDGATAVIGGIYQSNEQFSSSSTPLLGKIPILGYLFRNKFNTNSNQELLLFITPRIIKG